MKKLIIFALTLSLNLNASENCHSLINSKDYQVLSENNKILNKSNWEKIDVISSFDINQCLPTMSQMLILVDGKKIWRFSTTDDICDGGNSYGALYSYDLKKALAHIYDSETYCKEDWR